MQSQTTVAAASETKRSPPRTTEVAESVQDELLRRVVRLLESEHRQKEWTWSWLADQSELTPSAYYAWRKGKTKGHFLRRINSVLKPLGYRLYIGKLK